MSNLLLYIAIASLTIVSPGPGILLTLSNTLHYRFLRATWGIAGVVSGMAIIGAIASSSLGIILVASPYALTVVKIVGAGYLLYLGMKLFKSKPKCLSKGEQSTGAPNGYKLFTEGFVITLFNPKPIIFFMALFPQFIDATQPMTLQFTVLTVVFCTLVFFIHLLYGCFATLIRRKLTGDSFFIVFNRIAGGIFMLFGTLLGGSGVAGLL